MPQGRLRGAAGAGSIRVQLDSFAVHLLVQRAGRHRCEEGVQSGVASSSWLMPVILTHRDGVAGAG